MLYWLVNIAATPVMRKVVSVGKMPGSDMLTNSRSLLAPSICADSTTSGRDAAHRVGIHQHIDAETHPYIIEHDDAEPRVRVLHKPFGPGADQHIDDLRHGALDEKPVYGDHDDG